MREQHYPTHLNLRQTTPWRNYVSDIIHSAVSRLYPDTLSVVGSLRMCSSPATLSVVCASSRFSIESFPVRIRLPLSGRSIHQVPLYLSRHSRSIDACLPTVSSSSLCHDSAFTPLRQVRRATSVPIEMVRFQLKWRGRRNVSKDVRNISVSRSLDCRR